MSTDRRGFLGKVVGWGSALFGALVAFPAVGFLADPWLRSRSGAAALVRVARLDALPEGEPVKVHVMAARVDAWMRSPHRRIGAVWLHRTGNAVKAFAVECPHLGCAVDFRRDAERFVCPCHDSVFDRSGRRLSGPAPRDLDPIEAVVRDGEVFARLVRFEKGTASRVVVG